MDEREGRTLTDQETLIEVPRSAVDVEKLRTVYRAKYPTLSDAAIEAKVEAHLRRGGEINEYFNKNLDQIVADANRTKAKECRELQNEARKLADEAYHIEDLEVVAGKYLGFAEKLAYSILKAFSPPKAEEYLESKRAYITPNFKSDEIAEFKLYRDKCNEISSKSRMKATELEKKVVEKQRQAIEYKATIDTNDAAVLAIETNGAQNVHDVTFLQRETDDCLHKLEIVKDDIKFLQAMKQGYLNREQGFRSDYHIMDRLVNLIEHTQEQYDDLMKEFPPEVEQRILDRVPIVWDKLYGALEKESEAGRKAPRGGRISLSGSIEERMSRELEASGEQKNDNRTFYIKKSNELMDEINRLAKY